MGTRHLTAVQVDGKYRIAQYGQWDGYPEGQGIVVLNFLRTSDLNVFKTKCLQSSYLSETQSEQIGKDSNWSKKYPHLSRDAGSKILEMVYKSDRGLELANSIDFAGDGLFCEWAYVIDFDRGTFEVYRGFSKAPLNQTDRFYGFVSKADRDYQPVKLVKEYKLDNLPTDDEFIKTFQIND